MQRKEPLHNKLFHQLEQEFLQMNDLLDIYVNFEQSGKIIFQTEFL